MDSALFPHTISTARPASQADGQHELTPIICADHHLQHNFSKLQLEKKTMQRYCEEMEETIDKKEEMVLTPSAPPPPPAVSARHPSSTSTPSSPPPPRGTARPLATPLPLRRYHRLPAGQP
jgi:hypothetical protein